MLRNMRAHALMKYKIISRITLFPNIYIHKPKIFFYENSDKEE